MDNPKEQSDALKKLDTAFAGSNDLFRSPPRIAAAPELDRPAAGKEGAASADEDGPTNRPDKSRLRAQGAGARAQDERREKEKAPDVAPGGRSSSFSPVSGETAYFRKTKALVARRGELIVSKHSEGDIRCMVATRSTLAALGQLERVQPQDLAASDVAALEAELVAGEDVLDID